MKEDSSTLEAIEPVTGRDTVYRTISLLKSNADVTLQLRGYTARSIPRLEAAFADLGETDTVSPAAFISTVFQGRLDAPTPFRPGRYGNGSYPVFYAALDEETSTKERGYYYLKEAKEDGGTARTYTVFKCRLTGNAIRLVGQEDRHPELVSQDESGYPFCQNLGSVLRAKSDGLHAPSARNRPNGVCTPVFNEASLSEPRFMYWVVFSMEGDSYRRDIFKPKLVS